MSLPSLTELCGLERATRGRAYGTAHGYRGRVGGWIYNPDGKAVAQGWWEFYNRHHERIEAWRAGAP